MLLPSLSSRDRLCCCTIANNFFGTEVRSGKGMETLLKIQLVFILERTMVTTRENKRERWEDDTTLAGNVM